jgi:hypothetical protein
LVVCRHLKSSWFASAQGIVYLNKQRRKSLQFLVGACCVLRGVVSKM